MAVSVTSKSVIVIGQGLRLAKSSGTTSMNVTINSSNDGERGSPWQVKEVRLFLSTGAHNKASTFLVAVDSSAGVELVRQSMNSNRSVHYFPDHPVELASSNTIAINWINESTGKFNCQVIYRKYI